MLFLTSPLTSTPIVLNLIKAFGRISDLHVNMGKSIALNINIPNPLVERLMRHFPFTWSGIPYLRVNLAARMDQIYKVNYLMYKNLGTDLTSWSCRDISWLGRVNSVE